MTPAEAKATVIAAFPAFRDAKEVLLRDGRYWGIALRKQNIILKINRSHRGFSLSFGLIGHPPLERQGTTLADAIAALRQAKAEHARVLEALG